MSSGVSQTSTGIDSLDDLLDGLIPGDNVVWVGEDDALHDQIENAFLDSPADPRAVVILNEKPDPRFPPGVEVIDARPGARHADPMALEEIIVERGRKPGTRIVIRDLDTLVRRLGPDRALAFFARTCPRLFDLGAFAYWRASRAGSGEILGAVQRVTQCVLEHNNNRLRVLKAESRPGIGGRILDIRRHGHTMELTEVRALGRLAEGMRRIRTERGLTQTEVASLAGVSPSAVSQVESGHRGLALDTLLTLAEALSVSLDELLDHRPDPGYILARRDRIPSRRGIVSLLDDPSAGLRAHLITLNPGERGGPPVIHKGAELVLVGHGLVQIELEQEAPVIRPGDALMVTRDAIKGWRNLHPESARLFWIVRD